ncbi:uncharacterized protein LOC144094726 [Amblyomma americanum]
MRPVRSHSDPEERDMWRRRRRVILERRQAMRTFAELMERTEKRKSKITNFCDQVKADAAGLQSVCSLLKDLVDGNEGPWKEFFDKAQETGAKVERACASLMDLAEANKNMVQQFAQDVQASQDVQAVACRQFSRI